MEITVDNLIRDFRITRRRRGLFGAFLDVFSMESETMRALDHLSFDVRPGESVGYVGPNGSGKTTTVKVLTGILVPTSGTVRCGSFVPWRNRIPYQKRIGVVFGSRPQMTPELAVADHYNMLRLVYDVEKSKFKTHLARLVEMLQIGPFLERPARELSLGQRMRCEIAAAFLHQPDIVFLDEPSIGLDAASKRALRSLLRELNRDLGTTLFFTSHDARDIEASCDRMILIGEGRVFLDGDIKSILRDYGGPRKAEMRVTRFSTEEMTRLRRSLPSDADISFHAKTSTLEIAIPTIGSISTAELSRIVGNLDVGADALRLQDADLEDVIVRLAYDGESEQGKP